jgi:hypothetical protein
MEPNINVVKFCLYPILIAELAYRARPDAIALLQVTNAERLARENMEFITLMNQLDLVREHKAVFLGRHETPVFLAQNTDIVVSHQWENPLNYFYLETCWQGYPLVHNAHLCADLGYYYEGNDVAAGSARVLEAIDTHDAQALAYRERQRRPDRSLPARQRGSHRGLQHLLLGLDAAPRPMNRTNFHARTLRTQAVFPVVVSPSHDGKFFQNYVMSMMNFAVEAERAGMRLQVLFHQGESLVTRARNNCVAQFLANPHWTHLFWIDADIGFSAQAAFRLLLSGYDIAAGVYPLKRENWPAEGVAAGTTRQQFEATFTRYTVNAKASENTSQVELEVQPDGFMKMTEAPTGFMAIKRKPNVPA